MKKIASLLLAAGFAAAIGTTSNSCAPTAPNEVDTTKLESVPTSTILTRSDSSAPVSVYLSCGCNFGPLVVTGYGDTSKIHFIFNEPLTDVNINIHHLNVMFDPTEISGTGSDTTWIALYYLHNSVYKLYDTVRVIANY